MSELALAVNERTQQTKGEIKRARINGQIPAVLYGGKEKFSFSLNKKEFLGILGSGIASSNILTLNWEKGDCKKQSIIKEMQHHPITNKLLHVDFLEIAMDKKISLSVPLVTKGDEVCAKKGVIINHLMNKISIECFPGDIPKEIIIDIIDLEVGHAIHVKDLNVDDKIKINDNPDFTVVTLTEPATEEVKVAEVAEGEGTEESKEGDTKDTAKAEGKK